MNNMNFLKTFWFWFLTFLKILAEPLFKIQDLILDLGQVFVEIVLYRIDPNPSEEIRFYNEQMKEGMTEIKGHSWLKTLMSNNDQWKSMCVPVKIQKPEFPGITFGWYKRFTNSL